MRVIVVGEFSNTVRQEFEKMGHDAWSCDLLDTTDPFNNKHYKCDYRKIIKQPWDLMIAHPPCTFICNSGAKHLYIGQKKENGVDKIRWQKMVEGAKFFKELLKLPIKKKGIENPIMLGCAKEIIGVDQTQIIHPHQFGHMEQKATCLWLENLDPLQPTDDVYEEMMKLPKREREKIHYMSPGAQRWALRSTTYPGIAKAMAQQWG